MKKGLENAMKRAMRRLKRDALKQTKEIKQMAKKLAKNFYEDSLKQTPHDLKEFLSSNMQKLAFMEEKPEKEQKHFLKDGKRLLIDKPTLMAEKAADF